MIDKRVVTPDDLGEGIEWNESTQKYEAKLLFTERYIEANIVINRVMFLFRQLKNADKSMVCPGIRLNGEWYGDAPDGEGFIDAFADT